MRKWYYSILIVALFQLSNSTLQSFKTKDTVKEVIHGGLFSSDTVSTNEDQSEDIRRWESYLPGDLQPLRYDLDFFTSVTRSQSTYWGKVVITVKCLRNTNAIVLHQKNLNIHEDDVEIKYSGSDPPLFIRIRRHNYDSVREQHIIILRKTLEKDQNYEIKIEYSKPVKKWSDAGYLFDIYYRPSDTDEKLIAYTQMRENGARRVFPCFDQLGMKAIFKIKLKHTATMKGLSNTEKISSNPASDPSSFMEDEFTETVPMEASSVAIIVSDFLSRKSTYTNSNTKSTHSISHTDIRIFGDESTIEKLQSITEIATKIFQFFSDYFEVPYPFTKLDIIAMPSFFFSAVVSYGVIYMSESKLLTGAERTKRSANYEVVSQICHAISKQWIGHTVTETDWSDDWIQISLNLFLQTQCVIEMEPKWEHYFIEPEVTSSYFSLTGLQSTKNLNNFLVMGGTSNYLGDFFNKKLKKAYHLTRMIHFFLGQDIFQKSIIEYVKKFEFSNALFGDLWTTFTNTANTIQSNLLPNISVGEIMTSWVYQRGYPLITVTWKREIKQIHISQVPFNAFEEETSEKYEKRCWLIPLSYTTKTESKLEIDNSVREWLSCEDLHLKIDMDKDDWFLLDLKVNVIGRVNYDESIWMAIQKSLVNNEEPNVFHPFMRARLIWDMFFFAEIGILSYTIVLDTMKYLPQENHYENWILALGEFDKIRSRLLRSSVYEAFKNYVQGLLNSAFQKEDYHNISQATGRDLELKVAMIDFSCKYDDEICRQRSLEVIKRLKREEENLHLVPMRLHKTIYCQGIKYGNRKYWNSVWNLYEQATDHVLKWSLLQALGCSQSKRILKRLLEWSIDEKKFSTTDNLDIFESLCSNRKAYKLLRTFFMKNYNRISKFFEKSTHLYEYWKGLFNTTVKKEDLDQLLEFAQSRGLEEVSHISLHESRNRAEKNVAWLQKNEKILENYFRNNAPRKRWIFI